MVTCAVPGCTSSKKENPRNFTFHKFPINIDTRQRWLEMFDRKGWVPKKYSTICSKHFEQKCFSQRDAQRVKLRPGSVPTLFMPIVLNPKRKVSTYIYRDISPVPSSTDNFCDLENIPREKKFQKTFKAFRRRLNIIQKKLKSLRAQKMHAVRKVFYLSELIKHLESQPSLPKNLRAVLDSRSNDLLIVRLVSK